MALKRWIACADSHGDLIDPDVQKYFLDFLQYWDPHAGGRWHLGDFLDLRPLRKGASNEEKRSRITDDVVAGLELLNEFRPDYLTLGNHDERLWEWAGVETDGMTAEKAALFEQCEGLRVEIEKKLKSIGCRFTVHDVRSNIITHPWGGPRLLHGFKTNMYSAKAHAERWGSCVFGHVHTADFHQLEHYDEVKAYAVPAMCVLRQEYNKKHARTMKHRNGFLFGVTNDRTGAWEAWFVKRELDGKTWLDPTKLIEI